MPARSLVYCNSDKDGCQEVSGVKIWGAVDKEKVFQRVLTGFGFYGIIIAYTRKIELFV